MPKKINKPILQDVAAESSGFYLHYANMVLIVI